MIISYKNRRINRTKPVEVYRNLNKRGQTKWYSIRQNGKVKGHTKAVILVDAEFVVNESGRKRVRSTKRKNVHAYIRGFLRPSAMGVDAKGILPIKVVYNPFKGKLFKTKNFIPAGEVKSAMAVCINQSGVTAAYIDFY